MKETAVLRVPRTDDDDGYVLVHVTTTGPKGLDFKLDATDGADPFALTLKHNKLSQLKDKKHPIADDEWERILTEVLLDRRSDDDIEAAAQVAEGQSMTLIIRRSISGIKQRIGTIDLQCVEEQLDIVDWCNTALLSKKQIAQDLKSATAKTRELENAVKELKDQLEDLIQAKKADESELLVKFRDLLNEKKVKIREQQRLLTRHNVDPEETGAVPSPSRAPRQTGKGHVPKPSRASKRKAAEPEPEEDDEPVRVPGEGEEGEEDDDMEKMEVDKRHGEEDSEEDRTTDQGVDDDETGSEPDDDDGEPIPSTRKGVRNVDKPPAANTRHASQRKNESPPPPRTLPFNQRKAAGKPAPEPEPEGSETESDDEL
ncbi:hypothetical protein NKR19_g804 [Coniochaeta hoffmannii]|uniref:DNA double-strand break repair and VJ recombination XRCC4 n=1 Tax=Coniochaeta hoffmannii TaxID=91930 RepID=A0AA38SDE8_9PEZI|nr:hypothetical protein NKR19_g804 [Coniochaeta hoffmannii]